MKKNTDKNKKPFDKVPYLGGNETKEQTPSNQKNISPGARLLLSKIPFIGNPILSCLDNGIFKTLKEAVDFVAKLPITDLKALCLSGQKDALAFKAYIVLLQRKEAISKEDLCHNVLKLDEQQLIGIVCNNLPYQNVIEKNHTLFNPKIAFPERKNLSNLTVGPMDSYPKDRPMLKREKKPVIPENTSKSKKGTVKGFVAKL